MEEEYVIDFTDQIKKLQADNISFYSTWRNENPKKTAETYVRVFGLPDEIGKGYAKWDNIANFGGPTVIKDEEIAHSHPVKHIDFVYSTKLIRVTAEKVGVLAKCSGSIIVDQLKEETTARCHYLIKNAVTLGFVEDVVANKISDEGARDEYARRIKNNIIPDWYDDPLNEHEKTLAVDVEHHLQINTAQKKFGGVKRSKLKDSDFLDSKRRSFPVKTCQDVKDAVSSWGRYKGSMTFDQFKSRLTRRANKLGCKGSLPDKWTKK